MQKASIKCRSLRHMANRPPKRSTTFPRSPARKIVREPCSPKKREERRLQRKRWKPDETFGAGIEGRIREAAKRSAFRRLGLRSGAKRLLHDSPVSIRPQPVKQS